MPYTDFHYTPTGTGVISGKEVLEQTEDAINDLGGQISGDVQTAIDTANNALNVANTASTDAQNAVNTANTAYTAATNAQNTANAAQNTASNALTAAQNAQNDVNALGNRVTTAENNITQNTTDISGLTTRMGSAEGNITSLQNDVITAQGTATSAQNTATMARQQAYVLRYSGTAITDNSTIAYSTLDNTDNIKADDKIIDVDGKIFSIVSVDSDNSTVTVGSALIDLALDANVMHLSGNETASGKKIFSEYITSDGSSTGDEYSVNAKTNFWLLATRDTEEVSGVLFDTFRQNITQGTGSHLLGIGIKENSVRYEGCRFAWSWNNNLNGYSFSIRPTLQGVNQAVEHNLGTSNDKWDTINGINPGALSLPDLSNGIDISGYITTGSSTNDTYTAPADGYLSIILSSSSACGLYIYNYTDGIFIRSSSITDSVYTNVCGCLIPILKNQTLNIASRTTQNIVSAKFFPCLGNV